RMTERYIAAGPDARGLRKLRKAVRRAIKPVLSVRDWRGARVVGSGGTFTNLAGMHLYRQGMFSAKSVHGAVIPRTDVEHILDWLANMTPQERHATAGVNP